MWCASRSTVSASCATPSSRSPRATSPRSSTRQSRRCEVETGLWIIQGVLAGIFVLTGLTKLTQPREKMAAGPMGWAADVSDAQFRGIGALELLGAAGLILPGVLGIAGVITPLAAAGLALTMVGALLTHARLGETARLTAPVVLLALALLIALGRFGPQGF